MKRYIVRILFILAVTLPVYFYLGFRIGNTPIMLPILALMIFLILSFPFRKLPPPLTHITFICMGLISYFLVFTITRDLYGLISENYLPYHYILYLSFAAVFIGSINAIFGPSVRQI